MKPMEAALREVGPSADNRAVSRFSLHLEVEGLAEKGATRVCIHDISQTGMLLQTAATLSVGDCICVDLPEAGVTDAVVIWSEHDFFGCEFRQGLASGAISAALLRSAHEPLQFPKSPLTAADQLAYDEAQSGPAVIVLAVSLIISVAAIGILVAALVGL
jgi:hypothetical protein